RRGLHVPPERRALPQHEMALTRYTARTRAWRWTTFAIVMLSLALLLAVLTLGARQMALARHSVLPNAAETALRTEAGQRWGERERAAARRADVLLVDGKLADHFAGLEHAQVLPHGDP